MKKALFVAGALTFLGSCAFAQGTFDVKKAESLAKIEPYAGARCLPTNPSPACPVVITPATKCNSSDKTQVNPEELTVRAKHGFPALVNFRLDSDYWRFADSKPIEFTGANQLQCQRQNDKKVYCANKVDNENYYRYRVNLEGDKGARCTIDPGIFNQPIP